MPLDRSKLLLSVALSIAVAGASMTVAYANEASIPSDVTGIIGKYCVDCHGADSPEGDVTLAGLGGMDLAARLSTLNRAHQQVHFRLMPPEDEARPTDVELARLEDWISTELSRHGANDLKHKLRRPEYGNDVNHDDLFSGKYADLKGFTEDRHWLISEYIFAQKMIDLLRTPSTITVNGKGTVVQGGPMYGGLTNPFLLPGHVGVRYYAEEGLAGSQFLTMAANSEIIANYVVDVLCRKDKNYLPAVAKVMAPAEMHKQTVDTRRDFLQKHIARVCQDIYKDKNAALLPQHPPVVVTGAINEKARHYGKWGWRNNVGYAEGDKLHEALRVVGHKDRPKKDVIEDCGRYWYHLGERQEVVERRVSLLCKELSSIQGQHAKQIEPIVYKPLPASEMAAIESTIRKFRTKGMPYRELVNTCVDYWTKDFREQRDRTNQVPDSLVATLVAELYEKILRRPPTPGELADNARLFKKLSREIDDKDVVKKMVQSLVMSTEFIVRDEYGEGKPDAYGRRMMSPRNASYAIAYALTESGPDEQLTKAAAEGRLRTKEDYRREVTRILADRSKYTIVDATVHGTAGVEDVTTLPIRKLRFFREFFGFHKIHTLFKDDKRFGGRYVPASMRLLAEADLLLEHILEKDKNVFESLLTNESYYIFHSGDNDHMAKQAAAEFEKLRKKYEYFKPYDWRNFKASDLNKHVAMAGVSGRILNASAFHAAGVLKSFRDKMEVIDRKMLAGEAFTPKDAQLRYGTGGRKGTMAQAMVTDFFNLSPSGWDYVAEQPVRMEHRKGFLSHPAWLIATSQNFQTDPVVRGKWVREKLLAGMVPDVPITVDAAIPEDHTRTLRDRLKGKTEADACWKCHKMMNPLGNAFEMYDDFGRYRTAEELEHPDNILNLEEEEKYVKPLDRDTFRYRYKTLPVVTTGTLDGTGDSKLDGDVKDALDMIDRLSKSTRVRQSIIRHAFRFFMGRNERLSDSKTLMDADAAYVKSGGSFDAVIVSLLTSDSFMYRKSDGPDASVAQTAAH
jgi:hypothetical protein